MKLIEKNLIKLNELAGLFIKDERLRWYIAGLIDGYNIHAKEE